MMNVLRTHCLSHSCYQLPFNSQITWINCERRLADPFNWERVSERARLLLHVFVFHHTLGVLQVDLALQIVVIVPRVAVWLTNNTMTFTSGARSDFKFSVSSCWIRDVDGFFCGQNVSDLQRSGCISFHFWFNNHFSHEMWILCIETCDKEGLCVGLGGAGSCRLKWLWMFFIVD